MPQQPVAGLATKLGIDKHPRRHPSRLGKTARRRDRPRSRPQRPQLLQQAPLIVLGHPTFELSGIDSLAFFVATEIEPVELAILLSPTGDEEGIAVAARRLEPRVVAAGTVAAVLALGDDALQLQPAGIYEHLAAVGIQVLAEPDGLDAAGQQLGEHVLTIQ